MRDRLIELLCKSGVSFEYATPQEIADHLLAAGVIVPPCKVGRLVYVVRSQTGDCKNLYIFEDRITHYRVFGNYVSMCFENNTAELSYNWSNVFLTREEAEKALAERREG